MPAFDFIEEPQDEILAEDEFDFIPEEPIQQPTIPRLQPGATLADVLRQPPLVTPPWEGGVVRSVLPGVLQPEDLLPAVRKIGGAIAEGEPGDTHPDIITREQIPAIEIDQRGFTGPEGQFLDREAAAQATGIPTMREPGRLHSTDLIDAEQAPIAPPFEQPIEITERGPVYQSDLEAQRYGTLAPSDLSAWERFRRTSAGRGLFGPTPEEAELGIVPEQQPGLVPLALTAPLPFSPGPETMAGKALLVGFIGQFIKQAPDAWNSFKSAVDRGDWKEAGKVAIETGFGAAFTALAAKGLHEELKGQVSASPKAELPPPAPEPKLEPKAAPEEAKPARSLTPAVISDEGNFIETAPDHGTARLQHARQGRMASDLNKEGFVDESGKFLSRAEAVKPYEEIYGRKPSNPERLTSEDIKAAQAEAVMQAPESAPSGETEKFHLRMDPDRIDGTIEGPGGELVIRAPVSQTKSGEYSVQSLTVFVPRGILENTIGGTAVQDVKLVKAITGKTATEARHNAYKAFTNQINKEGFGGKSVPPKALIPEKSTSIGAGIQAALMRKAEAGAVPIPKDLSDLVTKSRDTIKTLAKTKDVRSTMTYTKDVAGNTATVYGQRVGNNIRGELKRAMGRDKANPLDEQALTFVRESNGDRSQLAVMRSKLSASTAANPKWKAEAIKAIDHAEANWDRMSPIASQYESATHSQIVGENAAGINTVERPGYVMHAQDVPNEFGFFSDVAGEGGAGFRHIRTHNTLADSIAAGVDPKSINAVTLLTQRVARGQMLINNRMWVEGLRGTTDPLTRKPVVTNPEVISRGAGLPPDTRAPEGYVMEIAGGRPIAILKPYAGIFRSLTEPSKFSESLGWNATLKAATTGKHIALLLDTFHLGRIAFWESIIKPLSLTDPKAPLPSYRKGILTLDYTPQELQRMAASGEIRPGALNDILAAKREVDGLIKHGYNVAKISDVLHQEWLQKIPITGTFNKWLFNQFQRGAMAEVGSLEAGRYRRMHPSWSNEKVYREVAKDLNTRFGNLGRQGILRSRTAQDTGRLLFLAPQWNEGLIRSEIGAVTGTVKGVASSLKEKRLSFGVLPRAIGTMMVGQFAANQIINYITRGHPTWQNPEEGLGAKLSAWVPDVVGGGPGFFLHPFGLAAEITHLLTQKYEKTADARNAILGFMGGRWSTLARPLMTFLTRRDVFQRLIRPEDIWKETAKAGVPLPIGASAAVPAVKERLMGEKKESFPGQYQKQMMASVGIKTDQAPSPTQRMLKLAGDFKKELGVKEGGEFYVSAYAPLRDALRRGALEEARKAYEDLIKQARTPKQIEAAVRPWTGGTVNPTTLEVTPKHYKPITGSAKHERMFLKTLNPEQRNTYLEARKEREQLYRTFRDMLRQTGP